MTAIEAVVDRGALEALRFPLELLRAECLARSGRDEEGLATLRDAMKLGKRNGARRALLIRPLTTRICTRALANDIRAGLRAPADPARRLSPPDERIAQWPWPLKITTLGGFKLFKDGEPLVLSRKTPRRLFTLLKAIVAFGGKDVPQDRIVDAVWPEENCIRPHAGRRVRLVEKPLAQTAALIGGGVRRAPSANEAEAAIDRDVVLIAKDRDRQSTGGVEPSSRGLALVNFTVHRASRSFWRSFAGLSFHASH